MRQTLMNLAVVAVLAAVLWGPLSSASQEKAADAGTWAVRGLLSDACQCQVFCPCELAEKPTFGHCNDTAIIHIEKGHFGSVNLDGHRIVVVSRSPDGERLVDTVGRLDFAHMYVPEEASDEQAEALAELARRIFGTWVDEQTTRISADETVEKVPMEVVIEAHRHKVEIPDVLKLDIQAITGGDGENPVQIKNVPANAPGMGDVLVARSNAYRYLDHGIDWDFAGRSASMRTLDLSGPIEEEAAAAVAPEQPVRQAAAHERHHH